jgi:hypothetical protein
MCTPCYHSKAKISVTNADLSIPNRTINSIGSRRKSMNTFTPPRNKMSYPSIKKIHIYTQNRPPWSRWPSILREGRVIQLDMFHKYLTYLHNLQYLVCTDSFAFTTIDTFNLETNHCIKCLIYL